MTQPDQLLLVSTNERWQQQVCAMLVEDVPRLRQWGQFACTAVSWEAAAAAISREQPRLILLELGDEEVATAVALIATTEQPVVALITGTDPLLETAVRQAGAADCLYTTDLSPALLRRVIYTILTDSSPVPTYQPPDTQPDSSPHLLFIYDTQAQAVVYTNQQQFLGYTINHANLIAAMNEWVHPNYRALLHERWQAIGNGRANPTPAHFQIRSSSGKWEWLQTWSAVLETDDSGHATRILASGSIITEMRQTSLMLQLLTERLQIIHEIDRAILTAQNPETIAHAVLPLIRSLLGAIRASISVIDNQQQGIRLIAVDGVKGQLSTGKALSSSDFYNLPGLKDGNRLEVPNIHIYPDSAIIRDLREAGIASFFSVALKTQDKVLGYLQVGFDQIAAFTREQVALLEETAVPLAIAMQQAQLLAQAQQQAADLHQREQYLLKLNQLSQIALSTLALPDMSQSLVVQLGHLFNADGCHLTLWDEQKQQSIPIAASGIYRDAFFNIDVQPEERTITQSVLELEQVIAIENTYDTPYTSLSLAQRFAQPHAILALPLIAGGAKLGAALIIFAQQRAFSEMEVAWAQQAAGQLALVVAKAHLLDEEKRQRTFAETLGDALSALNRTLEPDVQFNLILAQLQRVVDFDSASVMLLEGGYLYHQAYRSAYHHQEGYTGDRHISLRQVNYRKLRHMQAVIDDQTVVIIDDTLADDRWLKLSSTPRIRSWMGVPLVVRGQSLGLINLSKHTPFGFSRQDAERTHILANQVAVAITNSQLYAAMQRQIADLQLLHAAAIAGTEAQHEDDLIAGVTRILAVERFAEHVGVVLYDAKRDLLRPHPSYHYAAPHTSAETRPFPAQQGIAGIVLRTGQPQFVPDVTQTDEYVVIDPDTRSEISVPLTIHGRVIGIINAESSQPNAFTHDDLRLLVTIAGQLATAIERTRLFAAERARRVEAEQLRETTTALTTSLDLNLVLDNILEQIHRVVPYDSASIMLQQDEKVRVVAGRGFTNFENILNQSYPATDGLIDQLQLTKKPLVLADAQTHPSFRNWGDGDYIHGWLGVPLIVRDNIIGYLTIDSRQADAYTEADASLAFAFANQAAAAIENARLFHATEQHAHNLLLISEVLRDLNSALTVADALPRLGQALKAFANCQYADVLLIQNDSDTALLLNLDTERPLTHNNISVSLADMAVQPALQARRLHYTPDLASERHFSAANDLYLQGLRSRMTMPLVARGRLLGALNLAWDGDHHYDDTQLPTLQQVAQAIAMGLERSNLFDEISRRAHQLAILHNLGRQMEGVLNAQTLAQEVVNALHTHFHFANAALFAIDAVRQEVVLEAVSGNLAPAAEYRQPFSVGLLGQVARTGERVIVQDTRLVDGFVPLPDPPGLSEIVLPLRQGTKLLGILSVQSARVHAFDNNDTAVLTILADQLAVTLEKTRLFAEAQQRARELEAIASFSTALRNVDTIANIVPILLENVVSISQANAAYLLLRDQHDGSRVIVRGGYPANLPLVNRVVEPTDACYSRALHSGSIESCPNCGSPLCKSLVDYLQLATTQSFTSVPLRAADRVIGVVLLSTAVSRLPETQNLHLLTAVADIAGSAIDRALVLETLEERVEERTRELEAANLRLQELDALKSKFVSDVSHELRTPITNLSLYLDLLGKGQPDRYEFYLGVLRKQVNRLQQLLSDILDLSRLEIGASGLKMTAVHLNTLIDPILAAYQPRLLSSPIELRLDLANNLPPIWGERNQLSQVITNLLNNSLNYTPNGNILVRTFFDPQRNRVALQIADTGIGIEDEDRQHLFDRFYRGQRVSQLNIPGTGLGLAIVQEIVALHKGEIDLHSTPGQGTTFTIWLPTAN